MKDVMRPVGDAGQRGCDGGIDHSVSTSQRTAVSTTAPYERKPRLAWASARRTTSAWRELHTAVRWIRAPSLRAMMRTRASPNETVNAADSPMNRGAGRSQPGGAPPALRAVVARL